MDYSPLMTGSRSVFPLQPNSLPQSFYPTRPIIHYHRAPSTAQPPAISPRPPTNAHPPSSSSQQSSNTNDNLSTQSQPPPGTPNAATVHPYPQASYQHQAPITPYQTPPQPPPPPPNIQSIVNWKIQGTIEFLRAQNLITNSASSHISERDVHNFFIGWSRSWKAFEASHPNPVNVRLIAAQTEPNHPSVNLTPPKPIRLRKDGTPRKVGSGRPNLGKTAARRAAQDTGRREKDKYTRRRAALSHLMEGKTLSVVKQETGLARSTVQTIIGRAKAISAALGIDMADVRCYESKKRHGRPKGALGRKNLQGDEALSGEGGVSGDGGDVESGGGDS